MSEDLPQEPTHEDDMNFTWWLCMLPFFIAAGVMLYRWMGHRSEGHLITWAVGAIIGGIVVAALIVGMSHPHKDDQAQA